MTALWLRTTLGNNSLASNSDAGGLGEVCRFTAYSHGKSSWGGAVGSEPPILLTRTPNGGDSSKRAGPGVDCDQAPLGTP